MSTYNTTAYPIQSYKDLKDAVIEWADRDDDEFIDQVPNFINFAEKELYRTIRYAFLEKEAYLKIVNGQCTIPTDWLQTVGIMTANNYITARETTFEEVNLARHNKFTDELIFARVGKRWFFYPELNANLPNEDGTMDGSQVIINYFADTKEMVNDSDGSTLLTVAPDLLLYTALKHACKFVQDSDGAAGWEQLADDVYAQLKFQNDEMDYQAGIKVVDLGNVNQYW